MFQALNRHQDKPDPALCGEKSGYSIGASCRVDPGSSLLQECSLPAVSPSRTIPRKGKPVENITVIDRSALIYEALHGGVFGFRPDTAGVLQALSHIPSDDKTKIQALYQEHYGITLKADLRSSLPARYSRRATALLEGNDLLADIHTVYGELTRWSFRDLEPVMNALRRSAGVHFNDVAERLYHQSTQDIIRTHLSGHAQDRALLLAEGHIGTADATHLHALLRTTLFRSKKVITFLESLSPEERAEATSKYKRKYGSPIFDALDRSLTELDARHAKALIKYDRPLEVACSIQRDLQKLFPSSEGIIEKCRGKSSQFRESVVDAYTSSFGADLLTTISSRLKKVEAAQATLAITTGSVPPALRLAHAIRGFWTHEKEILEVLSNRSLPEIRKIGGEYFKLTNKHLRTEISRHLSGRDKFRALLALGGSPHTCEDALALLHVQQEFEKLSLSHYILKVISGKPKLLTTSIEKLTETYAHVWEDLQLTGEERVQLSTRLKFAFQNLESYKKAKEKVSEVCSNLFMSASGIVLATVAAPTLGPVNTLVFSTAGAALAKIAAKVVLMGRGYGWQSMPKDYLVGVLLRLRGQGGKRLFDATRAVIELLS